MSDAPITRPGKDRHQGSTVGCDTEVVVANRLLTALIARPLVQFRMGSGVHMEFGNHHEVTIETSFSVKDAEAHWTGEPLTAEAAGALLPLNSREVTSVEVAGDCTLTLGVGSATLTVPPSPMYEAWQIRGPHGGSWDLRWERW